MRYTKERYPFRHTEVARNTMLALEFVKGNFTKKIKPKSLMPKNTLGQLNILRTMCF